MASTQADVATDNREPGSRTSSTPLLGEGFSEVQRISAPPSSDNSGEILIESDEIDPKLGKRRLWGLGKKRQDEKPKQKYEAAASPYTMPRSQPPIVSSGAPSLPPIARNTPLQYDDPTLPAQQIRSSSPRVSSPASSEIFERNVQEDGLAASASPAIPGHITTENHIPPVLDASSLAITDDHLNPDKVAIVMHASHQPAAVTVTGTGNSEAIGNSWQENLSTPPDAEPAPNYGTLDSSDVRRLSFISFADVVHAEHADHTTSRDSVHLAGSPSTGSFGGGHRSPSPVRSSSSAQPLAGSIFAGGSASSPRLESSPARGSRIGSPMSGPIPPAGAELTIETMRQALRKTGSGDLSGARSAPMSAVGGDDGAVEQPYK